MKKRDYTARLVVYGLDYPGQMVYVSKWLKKLSQDLLKSAKKQNKTKKAEYSKRFIARLMK